LKKKFSFKNKKIQSKINTGEKISW